MATLYDHLQHKKWIFIQWMKAKAPAAIVEMLGLGMNLAEEGLGFVRDLGITTATGVYLERFGARVGVARLGMTDDILRAAIIVESRSIFGSGDSATILALVRQLVGPDAALHEVEFCPPHAFVIYVSGEPEPSSLTVFEQLLTDVPALTVNGGIVVIDDPVCCFSSVEGPVEITGGFGSVDGPVESPAGFARAFPL